MKNIDVKVVLLGDSGFVNLRQGLARVVLFLDLS
jgi:hypothetical protein